MAEKTVTAYLRLVAAGAREADEMVMPLVGWRRLHPGKEWWQPPDETAPVQLLLPPYATAGADHPDRWRHFGEMVEAICGQWGYGWVDALDYVASMSVVADPVSPNAAAAVALLLAAKVIKEDDE